MVRLICVSSAPRVLELISDYLTADLTWADIAWVRKHAPGIPVIVKGLATVEDVRLAKANGADGVILSNHGVCLFVSLVHCHTY